MCSGIEPTMHATKPSDYKVSLEERVCAFILRKLVFIDTFLYCSTYCVCVVLIVFVCFMFTVCTYTPEQIPGKCKPTWQ